MHPGGAGEGGKKKSRRDHFLSTKKGRIKRKEGNSKVATERESKEAVCHPIEPLLPLIFSGQ